MAAAGSAPAAACASDGTHVYDEYVPDTEDGAPGPSDTDLNAGGRPWAAPPLLHARTLGGGERNLLIRWEELSLSEPIGSGAFGDVWKAQWRGVPVAVKLLHRPIDEETHRPRELTEQERKSFMHEADLMDRVGSHACVIHLYGVCVDEDHLALVTEYCPEGSLDKIFLNSSQEVTYEEIISMAKCAAAGVLHLHANKVIHRDLALRNLLKAGKLVKVTDFGLSHKFRARRMHGAEERTEEAAMPDQRLPLRWMAPETLPLHNSRSPAPSDSSEASDAWMFGVVLWEMCARRMPYHDKDNNKVVSLVREHGCCLEIPEDCPNELAQLMRDCWKIDPQQRPQFEDIVRRLDSMCDTEKRRSLQVTRRRTLDEASVLYGRGQYVEAVARLRSIQQGCVVAHAFLAYCMRMGTGMRQDVEKGERELSKYFSQLAVWATHPYEDPTAQWLLGQCHEYGWNDAEPDEHRAAELFAHSAQHNNPLGEYCRALYYRNGRGGLRRDLERALDYARRSASQGHREAEQLVTRLISRDDD